LSHQVGLCVLLSAMAQIGNAKIDNETKNGARIFIVLHSKTFWLILSKGLRWPRR
jgi:hypothetical protein